MIDVKKVSTPNQIKRMDIYGKTWIPDVMAYHIADGFYLGTIGWEQNPESGVSSHFVIGKMGEVTQVVPLNMAAFTQMLRYDSTGIAPMPKQATSKLVRERAVNPNCCCISIEYEGFYNDFYKDGKLSTPGCKGAITQKQINATIALMPYIQSEMLRLYGKGHDIPLDREHNIGHCEINPIKRPAAPASCSLMMKS